ncbi:MAG: hypothetical protein L0Y56_03580 [Nitrospira sp.]|nr:hypothetical protein [Nitrospira sp.]
MKKLIVMIASLFSIGAAAEQPIATEYVSIDCPKGDISLKLLDNSRFHLELKYWNEKDHRHTHSDSMSGSWRYQNGELLLKADKSKAEIIYRRDKISMSVGSKSASIDGFVWENSSQETFADTFALVKRNAVDRLFLSEVPK